MKAEIMIALLIAQSVSQIVQANVVEQMTDVGAYVKRIAAQEVGAMAKFVRLVLCLLPQQALKHR
jgi:hypothetical protein